MGGTKKYVLQANTDLNNILEEGLYNCSSGTSPSLLNLPSDINRMALVIVVYRPKNVSYCIQIIYPASNDIGIYYRFIYGLDGTTTLNYLDWNRCLSGVPTFYRDYTDLSSLASALGANTLQFGKALTSPCWFKVSLTNMDAIAEIYVLDNSLEGRKYIIYHRDGSSVLSKVLIGNEMTPNNISEIDGFDFYIKAPAWSVVAFKPIANSFSATLQKIGETR